MSQHNPYLDAAEVPRPTTPYRVTFLLPDGEQHEIDVDPAKIPYGDHGQAGSLLDIALGHNIPLDHACGGVCACSTCHVIVRQGLSTCNEATDDEEDELDEAYGLTPKSRLACQCVPNGAQDLVVEVPAVNRNLVSEDG
jgi:2Fe-2S ferredoxin